MVPRSSVLASHFGQISITLMAVLYGFATRWAASRPLHDRIRISRAVIGVPQPWHETGNADILYFQSWTAMTNPTSARGARNGIHEEGRQTLAFLTACSQTVNVVLVALADGVELEVWADGTLRRRARFLRDTEARKYSERLAVRLERRGFRRTAEAR